MKPHRWSIALLVLVAFALGFVAERGGSPALARADPQRGIGRYPIPAYVLPIPSAEQPYHGCYLVDTTTGELWKTG